MFTEQNKKRRFVRGVIIIYNISFFFGRQRESERKPYTRGHSAEESGRVSSGRDKGHTFVLI
jgi:hypothetical protein